MEGKSNLKSLSIDELVGVINLYPWFGAARVELCERMSRTGGSDWGEEQFADASMYVSSRSIIYNILRSSKKSDYSDKDVESLLKEYISAQSPKPVPAAVPAAAANPAPSFAAAAGQGPDLSTLPITGQEQAPGPAPQAAPYRRTVKVVGGDFFTSSQYESVRQADDNFFSRFKAANQGDKDERSWEDPELGFCTETLAWIYAEQGYFAEAKKIYSRLILRYPEKSAYFASLIEKINEEN